MLTNTALKNIKPRDKGYKVADRDGLYIYVSTGGAISFRYDYRINGRRETLTIGRYDEYRAGQMDRDDSALAYGMGLSLAEARKLLMRARSTVLSGISPAQEKAEARSTVANTDTFRHFAEVWLRDAGMADSTVAMKRSLLNRDILPALGNKRMGEITTAAIMALCDRIKARGAPAPAVQTREIVQQVYRHAQARGLKLDNPAESIRSSAIATFKPRDRRLTPDEIKVFFNVLDTVGTLPTLKAGIKLAALTLCRKGELLGATWDEVDFEAGAWTVSAERMKMDRPHVVYLSQQAHDLLVALKMLAGGSRYLLPGRYDTDQPMSDATLNRVIDATVKKAREQGEEISTFSPHDLRRTASTLLHEAGFNTDWIEKCLAHEQRGVRAVYNKAEYAVQRRAMLQTWADMVDAFVAGTVSTSQWNCRGVELLQAGASWADVVAAIKSDNVVALRGKNI